MEKKNVSVQWGADSKNFITMGINEVDIPSGLHRLTIGRTQKGETFGSGYELYLSAEELTRLSRVIDSYVKI
jgi:hypothetical protein